MSGEDLVVDKGDNSPAEEAIAVEVSEETKPRQKRKRTKKSKVGKSEVLDMQSEKGVSTSDWVQSNPAVPDRAMSTPITCDSAGVTPVQSAAALARSSDKPTWGTIYYLFFSLYPFYHDDRYYSMLQGKRGGV